MSEIEIQEIKNHSLIEKPEPKEIESPEVSKEVVLQNNDELPLSK